jgi:hypothetical protein
MVEMRGGCHCGSISYVFSWPLPGTFPIRTCKCSFCSVHGAIYAAHPRAALAIELRDADTLASYRFATRTASMNFCARCGVFVYASSVVEGREYALLNVTTLHEAVRPTESIALSVNGETVEERLSRHRRTWIANVTVRVLGAEPVPAPRDGIDKAVAA